MSVHNLTNSALSNLSRASKISSACINAVVANSLLTSRFTETKKAAKLWQPVKDLHEPRKSVFISSRHPLAIQHRLFSRPTPSTDVVPSGNHWIYSRLRRHTRPGTFYYPTTNKSSFGFSLRQQDENNLFSPALTSNLNIALTKSESQVNESFSFAVNGFLSLLNLPRKSVFYPPRHPLAIQHRLFSRPTHSTDVVPSGNHWTFSRLRRHTRPGTFYFACPIWYLVGEKKTSVNLNLLHDSWIRFTFSTPRIYPVSRCFSSQASPCHSAPIIQSSYLID